MKYRVSMATNKIKMMMTLVNLKAYTTPQLLSTTSHHYSPLPMFINKSRYCPSNIRQIITCSSSNVPRFGIANPMASKEIMLLSTAQQPYTTTPFRSTSTADHQSFDPSCDNLLVAVENSIKHAARMIDTALQEYLENLEAKLSKANVIGPLLCTIKQLSTNMDKVVVLSELLLLAEKSSITLNLRKMQIIQLCNKRIENMQADQCWEEFPETPKEIFKAFRELILVDNNLRASLTDASTDKLIEDATALTMFQLWITRVLSDVLNRLIKKPQKPMRPSLPYQPIGPGKWIYTFYYGSNKQEWIDEFVKKAKVVIHDPYIQSIKDVHIELCCIQELIKNKVEAQHLSELIKGSGKKVPQDLRHYFVSGSDGRFVLTSMMIRNQKKLLLDESGRTILKVLEEFPQWKKNIEKDNDFEASFKNHYRKISSLIAGGEDIQSNMKCTTRIDA
ncbi:hypothetical protein F2P56_013130 [Juglans regia]|uniref:Uncharacterized protein LOC108980047 isoform X2 n=2 Tax=Juglans regia TaxID=51240 RepID=A0A2I4DGY8_JUGRE|nr:uncharacterized protein LOC108980047 isoform X2 [Juglans regia]KAF5469029.1 hypothetical protein F2P56_013130 [Juglans regia]